MINNRANLGVIDSTCRAVGTKLPAPIVTALKRREDVLNAARGFATGQGVGGAVTAALLAGNDPAADPAVQRAVTARALMAENIATQVEEEIEARTVQAYVEHVDAMVAAWSVPFDTATATLTAAHDLLGDVALDDAPAILQMGPAAATAWGEARAADAAIEHILSGWFALVTVTRTASLDRRHIILRKAAVTFEQWRDQELPERNLSAWDATRAGLTLALPTPVEYRARIKALEDGRNQQAWSQAEAAKDYNGRRPVSVR